MYVEHITLVSPVETTSELNQNHWITIAEVLGFNYDTSTDVMYLGDDSNNGFKFVKSNGTTTLKPYYNGSVPTNAYSFFSVAAGAARPIELHYTFSDNGAIFGVVSNPSRDYLNCYAGSLINSEYQAYEKTLYCGHNSSGNYATTMWTDFYYGTPAVANVITNANIISMSNLVVPSSVYYSDEVFIPTSFPNESVTQKFSMNGNNYVSARVNSSTVGRIIVRVR